MPAVFHELKTLALFVAATTSLINALDSDQGRANAVIPQLAVSLPPEPAVLLGAMPDIVRSDHLPPDTRIALQELPARISLARTMALSLSKNQEIANVLDAATSCWRQLCRTLHGLVRDPALRKAGSTRPLGLAAAPSTERLLAAAMLGGTPCIGPDGIVEMPGWLERRAAPRLQIHKAGLLQTSEGEYGIVVCDVSRTGAGIDGMIVGNVGDRVVLNLGAAVLPAQIVWRDKRRAGLSFDHPLSATDALLVA